MAQLLKPHTFFNNSAKRQHYLETVINGEKASVRVKDLCRTRWIYRHEAYENFRTLFKYLVTVMTAITSGDDTHG